MPAKISLDEASLFLYSVLKTVDNNNIDFEAVGAEHGMNKTQAYKRYWTIKKSFQEQAKGLPAKKGGSDAEGGESEGKSGAGVNGAGEKKKRKVPAGAGNGKGKKRKVAEAKGNTEEGTAKDEQNEDVKNEFEE